MTSMQEDKVNVSLVLWVFEGSQGVKLHVPVTSTCLKTRVLQSSCLLPAYSSPTDLKLSVTNTHSVNSCCLGECTWFWTNLIWMLISCFSHLTELPLHILRAHPRVGWRKIKKLVVEVKGYKLSASQWFWVSLVSNCVQCSVRRHLSMCDKGRQSKGCVHKRTAARATLCWWGLNQSTYSWG